ncbi:hypothetical protein C0Q70_05789 [Pomacea canaliculata]|uniref:Uncharacterized protein n=1 Tax=Pomacea canaliculata TaxID=400727 RepID=A0A2T7PM80_POMCA|nr:hypothetical protein C0Q70_05789 [Pomacea canaliculata]
MHARETGASPVDADKIQESPNVCFDRLLHNGFYQTPTMNANGNNGTVARHSVIHRPVDHRCLLELAAIVCILTDEEKGDNMHVKHRPQRENPLSVRHTFVTNYFGALSSSFLFPSAAMMEISYTVVVAPSPRKQRVQQDPTIGEYNCGQRDHRDCHDNTPKTSLSPEELGNHGYTAV